MDALEFDPPTGPLAHDPGDDDVSLVFLGGANCGLDCGGKPCPELGVEEGVGGVITEIGGGWW